MSPEMLAALGNHLWQSTLFAGAIGLITLFLRRNRPAVRYRLWLAASLKFLIPFSLLIHVGRQLEWPVERAAAPSIGYAMEQFSEPFVFEASSPAVSPTTPVERTEQVPSRIPAILFFGWLSGAAGVGLMWVRDWRLLRRAMSNASAVDLKLPIRVLMTPYPIEPGIVGIVNPSLLLPHGLMDRLTPAQVEAIVLHELCHVRRRDNLAAAVHMVVEAIFWFHPAVWWIERRLVEERERACDEEVLRLGGQPQAYAEGILNVCRFYKETAPVCVSGVTGSNLKKRIEDIMNNRMALNLGRRKTTLLSAAAMVAFAGPIAVGMMSATAGRMQPAPGAAVEAVPAIAPPAQASPPAPTGATQAANEIREAFEVASIRPTRFATGGGQRGAGGGGETSIRPAGEMCGDHPNSFFLKFDPRRALISDMTVYGLIAWAYGLSCRGFFGSHFILGGPGWIKSDGYDIEALIPEGAPAYTEQPIQIRGAPPVRQTMSPRFRRMLQTLLEDRFNLVVRRETRDVPVYALTVAGSGSKLRVWKEGDPATIEDWYRQIGLLAAGQTSREMEREMAIQAQALNQLDRGWFIAFRGSMEQLLTQIGRATDRPVLDRTGIASGDLLYRFAYSQLLAPYPSEIPTGGLTRSAAPSAPSLFTALEEELGLKLEATIAPMEVLAIESVERPSEN